MIEKTSGKRPEELPSYASYLHLPELLSQQVPLSSPVAHDELLFIITHQSYELWFKQILFELETIADAMTRDDVPTALHLLGRVTEIFRVLIAQIDVLETMTPVAFNRFRNLLKPASGFQSAQFRELEYRSGIVGTEGTHSKTDSISLKEAFSTLLARHGIRGSEADLSLAIRDLYHSESQAPLVHLCEKLIQYDEQVILWRFRHVQMVERMIGAKRGTGGSPGVPYLQSTLSKRFFPELWEARSIMGDA